MTDMENSEISPHVKYFQISHMTDVEPFACINRTYFRLSKMCTPLFENGITAQSGIKIVLQILLLLTFLIFFGVPAVKKYQRGEVMVVESSKETDGIELPSITIFEHKHKKEQQGFCYSLNESVEDCMMFKTQNLSSLINGVMLGYTKKEMQILDKNVVSEDFSISWAGRIFTIELPLKIGPNYDKDQIYLFFAPNYTTVHLYLHDSRYFIVNYNPVGLPTLITKFDARAVGNHFRKLALTEVNELDVPADPCNNDQSYNFDACIKQNIAKQVRRKEESWEVRNLRWAVALDGTPGVGKTSLIARQEINTGEIFKSRLISGIMRGNMICWLGWSRARSKR